MKKILFVLLLSVWGMQSCSDKDNKSTPAGGAGRDQAPTVTSADSSNGYGDKSADSLRH